ncbi:MAG: serine hydrolase [Faecalibacterium sp.]
MQTTAQFLDDTLLPQLAAFSGDVGVTFQAVDGSFSWHYHQNQVLPVASTMKLFVLGALLEQVELGNCSIDTQITCTAEDIIGGSGLLLDMQAGTSLSAYNMAVLMMLISDNTATNLLTDLVGGIQVVQAHMQRYGAVDSRINRKMSEDPAIMATGPFAEGTTAEYAAYLAAMHRGEVLNENSVALFDTLMAQQHYKNFVPALLPLVEDCPECWEGVAHPVHAACKTGWMLGIRCDAGYLVIEGKEYAYTVFSGNCADLRPTADNEGAKLLNACGLAFYQAVQQG